MVDDRHAPGEAPLTRDRLACDLVRLGVDVGQTLLVHASLGSIGWVGGGAATVVGALRDAVGDDGNLVAPASTEANSLTSRAYRARIAGMAGGRARKYLREMPPFDRDATSSGAGAISEAIRTSRDAVRSAHPQSSFAALGPAADVLMADHPTESHLGMDSPLGKLYERDDAYVLLLGVGYQSCSALHLAEYLCSDTPPRKTYSCVVSENGQRRWISYRDIVLDDRQFGAIGDYLEEVLPPRRDRVGNAESRLFPLRAAVDYATEWMKKNRS
jgi:aminoglycoside 3-N-acetyltransferase